MDYRFSNSIPQPIEQTLDAAGISVRAPSSKNYYGFKQDFEDIKANMLTAKFEHDLKPGLTVRNISRYGKSEQERVLTGVNAVTVTDGAFGQNADAAANPPRPAPTPPPNGLTPRAADDYTVARSIQGTGRTNEILTNQTNLTYDLQTGFIKHSLGGGLEFIYEKQYTPTFVAETANPAAVTTANLYNPDRSTTRSNFVKNGAFSDGQTITTAVYLFDTLHLSEQWLVNGSVRWERYNTETETVAAPVAPATQGLGSRVEGADNLVSWKTGVVFKPTPMSSVYASYANSLKPPGDTNFSLAAQNAAGGLPNANVNNPDLKEQEAENLEVGTKWDLLGGRLAATAALFKSTNKNDLARAADDPNVIIQYGKREVKGVELAMVGQITPDWNISAGVTHQDAEIKEGTATSEGAGIRFTPELTATLWTTYRIQPLKLLVGAGAQYVDEQTRNETNNPGGTTAASGQVGPTAIYKVDSYTVFDAMVAYEATKNLTVQLNGYNLFDEDYFAAINNGGSRYIPGTAASYLLSLNVKF